MIQNTLIVSKIDEPIEVPEKSNQENLNNLLDELVLFPDSYSLWEWNEQANMIVYFQEKFDRPIYYKIGRASCRERAWKYVCGEPGNEQRMVRVKMEIAFIQ